MAIGGLGQRLVIGRLAISGPQRRLGGRPALGIGLLDPGQHRLHMGLGRRQVAVVQQRLLHQRIELRIVVQLPPALR